MMAIAAFATYIPYERGERYAYGEHIQIPLFYALGLMLTLMLMVWYIRKVQKEKWKGPGKRNDRR